MGPGIRFIADIAAIHVDSSTSGVEMKGMNSVGFFISINENINRLIHPFICKINTFTEIKNA